MRRNMKKGYNRNDRVEEYEVKRNIQFREKKVKMSLAELEQRQYMLNEIVREVAMGRRIVGCFPQEHAVSKNGERAV